jgi:tyrosyl-tRNA synthetase
MRVPDGDAVYYELLLDEPFDPARPAVESKRALARALVARFHGEEAAREAEAHFDRLHVEHALPDEIEEAELPDGDRCTCRRCCATHFGISSSEARRLLGQGGVKLDGEPLEGRRARPARRSARRAVLQVGKRRFKRFRSVRETGPRPFVASGRARERYTLRPLDGL